MSRGIHVETIGLLILVAFVILIAATVGRQVPGVGLFSMVAFIVGLALGAFIPISVWSSGASWVYENILLIKDFILSRFGGLPEQTESPTAEDVAKFAGVCLAGIFALVLVKKALVFVAGLLLGLFLSVLMKFLGIPLPFG